jgi:hypothetical protein
MVSSSSRNGCAIQYVQVSYVAHVTPIPENLDSNEAASFLCAVRMTCCFVARRMLTITCTGCHCVPRVEVQPNKARRLDCNSWCWRRPRTSWFALPLVFTPISHLHILLAVQYAVHAFGLRVVAVGLSSFLFDAPSACFSLYHRLQTQVLKRKSCV